MLRLISFQREKKGLVMVNFFSNFLTCTNHSTLNDVIGERAIELEGENAHFETRHS